MSEREGGSGDAQNRTATGITLLGVLLSIAVTVAAAVPAPWWGRSLAGAFTAAALVVVVKLGTTHGPHGPLSRLARWIMNSPG